jgi:NADPH:quinone reductase-like Zn-dependent oxidoreductase
MKAAIRREYCLPDGLKIETIDKPVPGEKDVLIKVCATTVNRTDYAVLTGKPLVMRLFTGLTKPTLPVTGTDFAGRIEAVGKNVRLFQINDTVCGFNDQGVASHAEYMVFPEDGAMINIPDKLTYEQAAASMEGAHYAYNFINKVNLHPGQKILLNGATGAIGSALLQFLTYNKIYVTAVCSAPNIELIRSLGADKIYDYTKEDFTKDEDKYDFVFDAVGKSTFGKCKHLLKQGGAYISSELGPGAQNPFLALSTKITGDKRVIFPLPHDIKKSLEFIRDLIVREKFRPVIDKIYPLENISEAFAYVSTGQKKGNVIIAI